MHLVMSCQHDEKVVAQAIDLNKMLAQHDSLLSIRAPSITGLFVSEGAGEDEEHLLLRRAVEPAIINALRLAAYIAPLKLWPFSVPCGTSHYQRSTVGYLH